MKMVSKFLMLLLMMNYMNNYTNKFRIKEFKIRLNI
jgi:hypothetical protein